MSASDRDLLLSVLRDAIDELARLPAVPVRSSIVSRGRAALARAEAAETTAAQDHAALCAQVVEAAEAGIAAIRGDPRHMGAIALLTRAIYLAQGGEP